VSIFVNPTQFDDPADFQRYPRTLEADLAVCRESGAVAVFAPGPESIYPAGDSILVPKLPATALLPRLEDAHRPGHFAGVCQVVLRLFSLVRPTAAIFGEKDWQQLRIIQDMSSEAGLTVEILPYRTLRDADGLALSSRNRFLSESDRAAALAIPRALCDACAVDDPGQAEELMRRMLVQAGLEVEYAAIRDAQSLQSYHPNRPGRALIAARSGRTRLIDNAPWPSDPPAPRN
jgi:pantoate--beta-alanine ligase